MRRLAFVAVLWVFLSVPALAGIYVKEVGVDPGLVLEVVSSARDYSMSAWAGVYRLNIYGSDAEDLGISGTVGSFCIDIYDYSPSDHHVPYAVAPLEQAPDPGAGPMGVDRARYLATLLNMHWSDALTDVEAAALQTAVWEIVDEGIGSDPVPAEWNAWKYTNYGALPDSGNFYVKNYQVAMLANAWLGEVRNIGGSDYEEGYLALSNHAYCGPYYQDYVVRVPVPAASLLGVIGMAVAGLRLRRRAEA